MTEGLVLGKGGGGGEKEKGRTKTRKNSPWA